jgi:hypothetical protein
MGVLVTKDTHHPTRCAPPNTTSAPAWAKNYASQPALSRFCYIDSRFSTLIGPDPVLHCEIVFVKMPPLLRGAHG